MSSRTLAWAAWIIASIFYAYQYILRVMPNIMITDIMQQFDMGATTFGQFSGIYYIGYSLIHLPMGIILDRYGPKKVMSICTLLTVAGLMPLLYSDFWVYPIVGRLLIGIGSSAAILGVFKTIRLTFHEQKFPRMLSLSVTIGLLGAIYGGGPVSYMRDILGYHAVIQLFAVAGLALALVTYLIIPNIKVAPESSITSNLVEVFTNKRVILSCIFAGLMVGPLEGFADVWGSVFLKQVYGYEGTVAASLPSTIFIGMCFGAPSLCFIAEKAKNHLAIIIGSAITMASCFVLLLFWQLSSTFLVITFLTVGICCGYQILAIFKASSYAREEVSGLATAIANMIIMIFGYAFHGIIGTVVDLIGGPSQTDALIFGIATIPAALTLAAIGFIYLYVDEKGKVLAYTEVNSKIGISGR